MNNFIKYILISVITIIMVGGLVTAGTLITDRATKVIPEATVIAVLDDVTPENYETKIVEKGVLATERETMMKVRLLFNQQVNKCTFNNSYTRMQECTTALEAVNAKYEEPIKGGVVVEEPLVP